MKEKTIKTYISIINKVTKSLGKEFNQKELEDYLATQELKPSSYNLYRAVMNFYTEKELGYKITFSKAKRNQFLPIEVNKAEFSLFLSKIPNLKHKLGFRLMYESGLRVNELVNIKVFDIDCNKLTIRIRGKGNKDRYSIVPEGLAQEIKKFTKGKKEYVFTNQNNGNKLTIKTFQERLKKARKDAKIKKEFTCHSLRYSFIYNCLKKGIDKEIIILLCGYKSKKQFKSFSIKNKVDLTTVAKML